MPQPTPFAAHIQEPYTVLGVRLRPITIGHAMLLARLGGGAWIDGGEVGFNELALGVCVCSSSSFESFLDAFYGGRIGERISELSGLFQNGDTAKEVELFKAYLDEGMRGPKLLLTDGEDRRLGSHFLQILRVQLKRQFRTSESDVMNVPIAVALWDLGTVMELDKSARIWTDEDDELKAQADRFDAAFKARNGVTHG
jgi:hypothetical protein